MNAEEFVKYTTALMEGDGVTVKVFDQNTVTHSDGAQCSGWFDPSAKEMVVATGRDFWLEIFAHEYCHYTQWKDGTLKEESYDSENCMWEWLAGEDFTYEDVEFSVRQAQMIEADNERRTVEYIKKFGLPIDVEQYIQKSNAYVMFYDVVLKTRRWSGEKPVYSVPEIYNQFPSDAIMSDDEFRECPDWFLDLVVERCATVRKNPWWKRVWQRIKWVAAKMSESPYSPSNPQRRENPSG